ncbi:MAG: hypothetical protein MUC67_04900 [Acidobacteria bacterium]|jgi:hypothetical protein|nr:hypothetical protein [Acidobacteriota bacterium]
MPRDIQSAFADLQKRLTQAPEIPGMQAFRGPTHRTGPVLEAPPSAPEGRPTVEDRVQLMPAPGTGAEPWWRRAAAVAPQRVSGRRKKFNAFQGTWS